MEADGLHFLLEVIQLVITSCSLPQINSLRLATCSLCLTQTNYHTPHTQNQMRPPLPYHWRVLPLARLPW